MLIIHTNSSNKLEVSTARAQLGTTLRLQNLTTAQINADDIQIPMEVKVDQPDAQISINNGSWQNAREI